MDLRRPSFTDLGRPSSYHEGSTVSSTASARSSSPVVEHDVSDAEGTVDVAVPRAEDSVRSVTDDEFDKVVELMDVLDCRMEDEVRGSRSCRQKESHC
jgi:hypothetical protein